MEYKFLLVGIKPAYGIDINSFVKACDLGIEGAFIRASELITVTTDHVRDEEALNKLAGIIKQAYEQEAGWCNVVVEHANFRQR